MSMTAEIVSREGKHWLEFPAEFDVSETEVTVRRDKTTGEIVLTPQVSSAIERQKSWEEFWRLVDEIPAEELAAFSIPRDTTPVRLRDSLR